MELVVNKESIEEKKNHKFMIDLSRRKKDQTDDNIYQRSVAIFPEKTVRRIMTE